MYYHWWLWAKHKSFHNTEKKKKSRPMPPNDLWNDTKLLICYFTTSKYCSLETQWLQKVFAEYLNITTTSWQQINSLPQFLRRLHTALNIYSFCSSWIFMTMSILLKDSTKKGATFWNQFSFPLKISYYTVKIRHSLKVTTTFLLTIICCHFDEIFSEIFKKTFCMCTFLWTCWATDTKSKHCRNWRNCYQALE